MLFYILNCLYLPFFSHAFILIYFACFHFLFVGTTGQTVTVICIAGYTGSGTATCRTDGSFNTITCAAEACAVTQVANSNKATTGSITGTTGSTTTVTCSTGYAGTATYTATCGTSGTFNAITCAAEACAVTQVANSNKATTGSITGTTEQTVAVTCDVGYTGSGTATCGTGGTFNTITCAAEACTVTQVANSNKATTGSITGTTGQTVTVACNDGYSGGGTATCGTNSQFNTLTCVAKMCTYNDQSGRASCKSCAAGQEPTSDKKSCIECVMGKYNDNACTPGTASAAELAWKMWNLYTCVAMQEDYSVCTTESDNNHKTVMSNCPVTCAKYRNEQCPSSCKSCADGHEPTGDKKGCVVKSCKSTGNIANSNRAAAGSITGTTGQTVTVACNDGYSGGGTATCGTNSQFNTLTCVAKTCTASGNVANSNKAAADSITGTTGQTVAITCDTGYFGSGIVTCGANSKFNTLTCVAKSCTSTGNVANSNKAAAESITGTTGQSITVTCNAGYIGTGTTVCQPSGKFTTLPTCVACDLGTYNDETAKSICKDDCNAGSKILQDKSSCDLCPYGTWQDENDKSSCKKCIAGKISKKAGQISISTCEKCVVGLYNPYEGHDSSCMPCPTAAETGASECAGW